MEFETNHYIMWNDLPYARNLQEAIAIADGYDSGDNWGFQMIFELPQFDGYGVLTFRDKYWHSIWTTERCMMCRVPDSYGNWKNWLTPRHFMDKE